MAHWTYEADFTLDRDKVRVLIGDTTENEKLINDEEIAYALTRDSNILRAAAICCEYIAAKLARRETTQIQGQLVVKRAPYKNYLDMAKRYRRMAKTRSSLYALLSSDGKLTFATNTDLIAPRFPRDLFSPDSQGIDKSADAHMYFQLG